MNKKVKKDLKQKQNRQRQATKQKQQYKKKIKPIVELLKKKGLKFTGCNMVDQKIQYFRLDELQQVISKCNQQEPEIKKILRQIDKYLLYFKRPDHTKLKYPKSLEFVDSKNPDKKYACFKYDTTQSKMWIIVIFLVGLMCLILFPIWPFWLKYAVWLVSFILSILMLGLIVVRLIIYLVCVIVGYNVWIFPNLMAPASVIDSFKPLYVAQKWQISVGTLLFRVGIFGLLICCGVYMVLHPDQVDHYVKVIKTMIFDVHDWGVNKLENKPDNFSQRAIQNLEDILNRTKDVDDL